MSGRTHLDMIIDTAGLSVRFQPVFELSEDGRRRVHFFEGLSRGPAGTNLANPDILFAYARRRREERRLDLVCVANIVEAAAILPAEAFVSFNVHASTLSHDCSFVGAVIEYAEQAGIALERLIVEVVEHASTWNAWTFSRVLEQLRARGVRVALDDIGLGLSNYRMIVEARPDYFKIDRFFVEGTESDPYRRAVIESIVQLADRFGARVIAEGIERPEDLAALRGLGIDLFQGFLFARPLEPASIAAFDFLPVGAAGVRLEALPC